MTTPAFAAERRRTSSGYRSISPARRAQSSKPAGRLAAADRRDRRTDGRTADRYIEPAPHTMRTASTRRRFRMSITRSTSTTTSTTASSSSGSGTGTAHCLCQRLVAVVNTAAQATAPAESHATNASSDDDDGVGEFSKWRLLNRRGTICLVLPCFPRTCARTFECSVHPPVRDARQRRADQRPASSTLKLSYAHVKTSFN